MLKNLSKLKIEKRLSKSFTLVSLIASIAAVIGLIALIITTTQYSSALKNYGFTQGDIGKALVTFADTRAATRGIIAYQQKDLIDSTKTIHDAKKQKFLDYMTTVEETMTSDEEKAAYQEAETQLEKYWTLEDKVIKAGATTDAESSIEAQKTESGDLNELYDEVYAQLAKIMDLKVTEGDALSQMLTILSAIMIGTYGNCYHRSICCRKDSWSKDCKDYCRTSDKTCRQVYLIYTGRFYFSISGNRDAG